VAGVPKTTRYGTHFKHLTVDRALGCDSLSRLKNEVMTQFPETDITLVLAYDGKYGGLAVVDTMTSFRYISAGIDLQTGWSLTDETAVHEFMHWLGLSDEYLDTAACNHFPYIIYGGNITHDTVYHRTWDHWLGTSGIGYVSGGICPGNFIGTTYPTMMSQTWGNPAWGPINGEIISSKVSAKISPIYAASSTAGFHQWISIKKVDTQNKLKTFWVINGDTLSYGVDSIFFNPVDTTKAYTIDFFAVDTNRLVKNASLYPLSSWHKQWRTGSTSLPVILISFTATPKSDRIQLKWTTTLEINNKGFHVERSEDASSFQEIGWVDGFGATTVAHDYIFNDYDVIPQVPYYYRLQQEDLDGHKNYSSIVSGMITDIRDPEVEMVSLFPNPGHDEVFLRVDSPVWITFINSLGISSIENEYVNQNKINISDLVPGVYTVIVRRDATIRILRFVKE
jgi:hypothetical protein